MAAKLAAKRIASDGANSAMEPKASARILSASALLGARACSGPCRSPPSWKGNHNATLQTEQAAHVDAHGAAAAGGTCRRQRRTDQGRPNRLRRGAVGVH